MNFFQTGLALASAFESALPMIVSSLDSFTLMEMSPYSNLKSSFTGSVELGSAILRMFFRLGRYRWSAGVMTVLRRRLSVGTYRGREVQLYYHGVVMLLEY